MSRNLGEVSCHECPGEHRHIVLEEEPRPAADNDIPEIYRENYAGLIVAKAKCSLCHTLYLAWVDWPSNPYSQWHLTDGNRREGMRFTDLSYRHSFNDEPSVLDLPVFEVQITYVRKPLNGHPYLDARDPEGVKQYEARARAAHANTEPYAR